MRFNVLRSLITVGIAILGISTAPGQVIISEFLASNNSGLQDGDGDYPDWIELYNPTIDTVALDGWFLTDDASTLTKWQFPDVAIAPGDFLIVFASNKDRRDPAAELHTNFALSAAGEYLGLIRPDGVTVAHDYGPQYPPQLTDVSYGLALYAETFAQAGDQARYWVPSAEDADWDWTAPEFDDALWPVGSAPLEFGPLDPGFLVKNFKSYLSVNNLNTALQIINVRSYQASVFETTAQTLHFSDVAADCHYDFAAPIPGHTAGKEISHYVIEATGGLIIPEAGPWTFGVRSSDGFRVDLTGETASFRFDHPLPRTVGDTLGVFEVPEAGVYAFRLVHYKRFGNATLELFAAPGEHADFDAEAFRLVGDTANGGLSVVFQTGDLALHNRMVGVNPSLWTRMRFNLEELPPRCDMFLLRVQAEDGFVAWLNGHEVARANAPAALTWDSAATDHHPPVDGRVFQDFDLAPHLDRLRVGNNVLAIQGLNDAVDDQNFFLLPQMRIANFQGNEHYYASPSPGRANTGGAMGIVDNAWISQPRGFQKEPFTVEIASPTSDAIIRYTLNGSTPTFTNGLLYEGPISISQTSILRAAAFKTGWLPSNVETRTYLFLADVITQPATRPPGWRNLHYGMDPRVTDAPAYRDLMEEALTQIPTWSIVTDDSNLFGTTGIYSNPSQDGRNWERPSSFELIYPDGTEGFQIDGGLRIRGGFSRSLSNPKHAFRLFFRREYGASQLEYPLFGDEGADTFDKVDLRTSQNYSWSFQGSPLNVMIRDTFSRDTQRDLGQPYTRSRKYHLYLNGLYWGIYETQERAEARFARTYFGGETEDYDVVKVEAGPYVVDATDGTTEEWNRLWALSMEGFRSDSAYYRVLGCDPDGVRNPDYPVLVDPDNLIDYMLRTFYVGDMDGPLSQTFSNTRPNNFYAIFNRTTQTEGWKFFAHDAEHSLHFADVRAGAGEDRTGPFTGGNEERHFNPQWLHQQLIQHPAYRARFADRARLHMFEGGALTPEQSIARFSARAEEMDVAIIAESARWGASKTAEPLTRDDHWRPAVDKILHQFFPTRTAIVLGQLKRHGWYPQTEFPTFSIAGTPRRQGFFTAGEELILEAPEGAEIYYTLDGTDPGVFSAALSDVALIDETSPRRVFVPTADNGAPEMSMFWKARVFDDSDWRVGAGGVGYDINTPGVFFPYYDIDVQSEMYGISASCYVRIPFTLQAADLARMRNLTLHMRYDDGIVVYLNGARILSRNTDTLTTWQTRALQPYDNDQAVLWETVDWTAHIPALREGTNTLALHGLNHQQDAEEFLISARLTTFSMLPGRVSDSAIRYTGPIPLTDGMTVFARALGDIDWSAATVGSFIQERNVHDIIITEVMADVFGNDTGKEWFEVFNTTDEPIHLNSWTICDNGSDLHTIHHPDGVIVPARGHLVLGQSADRATNGGAPVDYAYGLDITLGNSNDCLVLRQGDRVIHSIGWGNFQPGPWAIQVNLGRRPTEGKAIGMADNYYHGPADRWVDQASLFGTEGAAGTPGVRNNWVLLGPDPIEAPPPANMWQVY